MPEHLQPHHSHHNLGAAICPIAADCSESETLQCSICTNKYDCDSKARVPHVLPSCGHTFCAGCIGNLGIHAQRDNSDTFACPNCNARQLVGNPCPTNWELKMIIDGLRSKSRKRPANFPPTQDSSDALTCPRHINAAAAVLCFDCTELMCYNCAFECSQNHHKCEKADAILLSASTQSSVAIDAVFERGRQRIQARLQEEIRQLQTAASRMNAKLQELCENTKATENQEVKSKIRFALLKKDARGLCQLLQEEQHVAEFDVDIQGQDIIVRRRQKISYDNGTVYEGFVSLATGLADGEGSVTWGPSAGRSSRKSYAGLFTAGRTAERVKFGWKEKRPGQIGVGNHAYNGTVEVESGAWTGQAYIQYDVSEGGSYEGGVVDGKYHGWGRHTDTLGTVTEGNWIHGQFDK